MKGRTQIVWHLPVDAQKKFRGAHTQSTPPVIDRAAFMGNRLGERQDGLLKMLRHDRARYQTGPIWSLTLC